MLKRPYISEKSMELSRDGLYTFEVPLNSTKQMIAKIVAEKFKVEVIGVRTINIKGKRKLQRSRKGYFNEKDLKKALVRIKKGQKIAMFENLGEQSSRASRTKEEEVEVKTGESQEKVA